MAQINTNCPRCRRFTKALQRKRIAKKLYLSIGICGKCDILIVGSWEWIGQEHKEKSREVGLTEWREAVRIIGRDQRNLIKMGIEIQVLNFLKQKLKSVKMWTISKEIGISLGEANKALKSLMERERESGNIIQRELATIIMV